jgi:hypothetical protein
MAQSAARAAGPVGLREVALIDGVSDERAVVASTNAKFEAALAKSNLLADDDDSAEVKRTKEKVMSKEARLTTSRARLRVV